MTQEQNKRKRPSYGPDSVDLYATTKIDQETFSYLWKLKSYTALTELSEVRSPIFIGGPTNSHKWQLKLYPKYKFGTKDYLSVYLILIDFGDGHSDGAIKARFEISLLMTNGLPGKQIGETTKTLQFSKGSDFGGKLILASDLMTSSEQLVENNSIKVHCRIWIDGELKHKICPGGAGNGWLTVAEKKKKSKERLAQDFGRIFRESVMTDISIATSDECFLAHKVVLSARSTVFAAMLECDMAEKVTSKVDIVDFDDDVVRGMLEYLYTGETEAMVERAPDLLRIADKYDLPGLKKDCEQTIAENLTAENAAEMLNVAHLHQAKALKQCVLNFINCHKEEVKKSKGLKGLTQDALLELFTQ